MSKNSWRALYRDGVERHRKTKTIVHTRFGATKHNSRRKQQELSKSSDIFTPRGGIRLIYNRMSWHVQFWG